MLWLAPKEWLRGPVRHKQGGREPSHQQEPIARFEFGTREGDDIGASENSDYHWLTRLCGLRLNQMGFAWVPNEEALGLTGRKADWKKLLREHSQKFLDRGFLLEERQGRLFLPVRVDQEELARAYENEKDNSIDDPLAPVITALENIHSRTTDFGDLLNLTRTKFGEPTKTT